MASKKQSLSPIEKVASELDKLSPHYTAVQSADALYNSMPIRRIMEEAEAHQARLDAIADPLKQLRHMGMFDDGSALRARLNSIVAVHDDMQSRYLLPATSQIQQMMEEIERSQGYRELLKYTASIDEISKRAVEMSAAWIDIDDALKSVSGFVEMQGLGLLLSESRGFDDTVTRFVRSELGDWRDEITWPTDTLTQSKAREELYDGLGFNHALTDFPPAAFHESVTLARLTSDPPPLVAAYGDPVPSNFDETDESAIARTNSAHEWLFRLENWLRWFIDTRMTAMFGDNWPKIRLAKTMYDKWVEKRQAALAANRPECRLIAYADFTDIPLLICKRDNWREVFATHFDRPESVRESFNRLHFVRIDTMHGRAISQDDELLLYVEAKRLTRCHDA